MFTSKKSCITINLVSRTLFLDVSKYFENKETRITIQLLHMFGIKNSQYGRITDIEHFAVLNLLIYKQNFGRDLVSDKWKVFCQKCHWALMMRNFQQDALELSLHRHKVLKRKYEIMTRNMGGSTQLSWKWRRCSDSNSKLRVFRWEIFLRKKGSFSASKEKRSQTVRNE